MDAERPTLYHLLRLAFAIDGSKTLANTPWHKLPLFAFLLV